MPKNGYWVECAPLDAGYELTQQNLPPDLYTASSASFPDITEIAPSPDLAIEKLRSRLKTIRQQYHTTGKLLPEMDNPVRPPTRLRSISGWISVYIEMGGDVRAPRAMLLHSLTALALLGPCQA